MIVFGVYMFGIGFLEFLVILIVAILIIQPKDMPYILKNLLKYSKDFNQLRNDLKHVIVNLNHSFKNNDKDKKKNSPK